jgi:hypothetical protein
MRVPAGLILALRVAYGVTLLIMPERVTRRWLGRAVKRGPTQVPLRALGMREIGIHVGALHALFTSRPLRPWLLASLGGDLADITATTVSRDQLPGGAAKATLVVGGGSAALTAALILAPVSRPAPRGRETD